MIFTKALHAVLCDLDSFEFMEILDLSYKGYTVSILLYDSLMQVSLEYFLLLFPCFKGWEARSKRAFFSLLFYEWFGEKWLEWKLEMEVGSLLEVDEGGYIQI